MFNRRFIREKTIQAYYGFAQGGPESALACQKNLLAGLDQTAELYYQHLSFLIELSHYTRQHYIEAAKRGRRSQDELEVLRLMAQNSAIEHIAHDPNYLSRKDWYKFNWKERHADLVSAVYESIFLSSGDEVSAAGKIRANLLESHPVHEEVLLPTEDEDSDINEAYGTESEESPETLPQVSETIFERDREYIKRLYKRKISTNPVLRSFCEERSIFWESDYDSVVFWVCSLLAKLDRKKTCNVDPGWTAEDEDIVFGKTLLEKTLLHQAEYDLYIASCLTNWKPERIGTIENVLLRVAVCELIQFPSIPVKVTLNEYIELSKRFCSPESAAFINGVLNKLAQDLKADKKIKKSGRGLL